MAGGSEHRGIARSLAAVGVRRRVERAAIRFDFDDAPGTPVPAFEELVEKLRRDETRIPPVKRARQRLAYPSRHALRSSFESTNAEAYARRGDRRQA
jgi:hypothetical protein